MGISMLYMIFCICLPAPFIGGMYIYIYISIRIYNYCYIQVNIGKLSDGFIVFATLHLMSAMSHYLGMIRKRVVYQPL